MNKEEMFWTDHGQARERLSGTVILYDNEPVYVENISDPMDEGDGIVKARIVTCDENRTASRKRLDSPKFKRFRELPKLGWMNSADPRVGALFFYRKSVRTRSHGLSRANVNVVGFPTKSSGNYAGSLQNYGEGTFDKFMFDNGFKDMHHGRYPSLESVLSAIQECSSIAFANRFCVVCDDLGVRWLIRDKNRVGIFGGDNTLFLFKKFAFLREEIMAEPRFTVDQIREF